MKLLTVLLVFLIGCILTHSQTSLSYAAMGLNLWFQKMIPTLLPFMILSGIMVRLKLTDKAAMVIYPIVRPLYRVRKNVCYAMLMGFLCGFPMGARVVDDLYLQQMITKREAEYLLAFCNNIGPVYFCSFVLPLLHREMVFPYLFGMYGIPLLYGLVLRYTTFRDLSLSEKAVSAPALIACSESVTIPLSAKTNSLSTGGKFLKATEDAIQSSIQSILSLGGYMILYNLLNLIPHILIGHPLTLLSPLLEITGGLTLLGDAFPLYSLLALSFGGASCIAQTYSCIGNSDLPIGPYILHKILLTFFNGVFYLIWFLLTPISFLR